MESKIKEINSSYSNIGIEIIKKSHSNKCSKLKAGLKNGVFMHGSLQQSTLIIKDNNYTTAFDWKETSQNLIALK